MYGSASDNPYQFVGESGYYAHFQEPGFDLFQLGVRYYDSIIGRFSQRDSLDDNGYAYANNSPSVLIDFTGRKPVQPSDRRFPKPNDIPSFIWGMDDNWYPSPQAICLASLRGCIETAATNATQAADRQFPGGLGAANGPKDAYRHCVWACLTRRTCGRDAYNLGVIGHEVPDFGKWDPVEGGLYPTEWTLS